MELIAPSNDVGGNEALGINNVGHVVGWKQPAPGQQDTAHLWIGGVFQHLGTLGGISSASAALNEADAIVGRADTGVRRSGALQHVAFMWTSAAGMKSLGLPAGRDYAHAWDINELNWVVGESWQASGSSTQRSGKCSRRRVRRL